VQVSVLAWALPALDHCHLFCILIKPYFQLPLAGCALWPEWGCVNTANVMRVWLVSRGRGLSTAAAAGLWAGDVPVQVAATGSAGDQGAAMGWCVQGQLCVCVYVRVHIPLVVFKPDQLLGGKRMKWQAPLAGWETGLLRRGDCQHSRADLKLCRNHPDF